MRQLLLLLDRIGGDIAIENAPCEGWVLDLAVASGHISIEAGRVRLTDSGAGHLWLLEIEDEELAGVTG